MTQLDSTSLTWDIEDFANVHSDIGSDSVDSETSSTKLTFCLSLHPNDEENKNFIIKLYLFGSEEKYDDQFGLKVLWTIALINDKGEECYCRAFEANITIPQDGYIEDCLYYLNRDAILDPSSGLLPAGKLTVKCTVITMTDLVYQSTFSNLCKYIHTRIEGNQITLAHKKVRQNYQSLLESSKFSDVVFVIGQKEFKLHKNILAAQSAVFSAMFESDLEEARQNRVEITDVDAEVFEAMILFIYSGNADSVNQYALNLFVAADKYQLDHLKSICEESLITSLAVESVCSLLLLADMHNAQQLKEKSTEYFSEHSKEVFKTEGWKELVKSKRIDLVAELFEKFVDKHDIEEEDD